jgi:DNA-binding NtrC family response regulator
MAQLVGLIVSEDDAFKKQLGRLLRSGAIPVSVIDGAARDATPPDVVLVDARGDATSAMSSIERLRGGNPGAAIFAVALAADPDLILQSMRAGANEFFTWPPAEESFQGAIRRTAARRESAQGARPPATTLVFFGAKGGAGHDRRGELRRRARAAQQQALDSDRGPEAGPRRSRPVPRRSRAYSILDRDRQPAPASTASS